MHVSTAGSLATKPSELGAADMHAGSIPETRNMGGQQMGWEHFSS